LSEAERENLGFVFAPHLFYGHFREIGMEKFLLALKPRHVAKFREC